MRKYLTILSETFVTVIILFGCTPVAMHLKGTYPTVELHSANSADSVWASITNLMTRNGLKVKRIDRSKGILVSEKTSFIRVYSVEDSTGRIQNPEAWVVLPRAFGKKKEWKPKIIYSTWSIQFTEAEKGMIKTKIDPVVICTYFPNMFTKMETHGQSTGKLEELINGLIR